MRIGINRQVAKVEIADKEYTIKIVPLLVEHLIVEHDTTEKEFSKKVGEGLEDELEIIQWNQHSFDLFLQMVQVILEANGYEYDREWWLRNADGTTLVEFIASCRAKDFKQDKKKQAQGEN